MSSINLNLNLLFGSPGLTNVEKQIKSLIQEAEANIERLTTQIRELSCIREREKSILATLRLISSPMGKLPTELLCMIFKLAVDPSVVNSPHSASMLGTLYEGDSRAALRRILCLSQVSPYWRQIVHNAPQLWAQGVVEICLGQESKDRYLEGLESLLARSKPLPISVSLIRAAKGTQKASTSSESSKAIARIVTSTAHRLKNLSIDLPSFRDFNEISPGTFEALERLFVDDFSRQKDPVFAFQSSPRLRTFTFNSGMMRVSKLHLFDSLPWVQLTHLEVEDASLKTCRTVLTRCNNLVWAKFNTSFAWKSDVAATESPVITLPCLNELSVTFHGIPDSAEIHGLEAFLLPLALPALESLELNFHRDGLEDELWPTQVFSEFQSRSPNIEEISLTLSAVDAEGLIALLRNGHALTALKIEYCENCVNDDFLNALRYDAADPAPLAPKLQDISLDYVGDEFQDDTLEAFIRSRWWQDGVSDGSPPRVSRLQNVAVSRHDDGNNTFSLAFKHRMQDLANQGLYVDLA